MRWHKRRGVRIAAAAIDSAAGDVLLLVAGFMCGFLLARRDVPITDKQPVMCYFCFARPNDLVGNLIWSQDRWQCVDSDACRNRSAKVG